jgi:phage terminase large subunit-like protein
MYKFLELDANYRADYTDIANYLNKCAIEKEDAKIRNLIITYATTDLFFLMYFVLNIPVINHPWLVDRIREVEENHNRTLDLWAREHFKSTIITYALSVQKILQNPNYRIAIFSNTKAMAKKFLNRIKLTLEQNKLLQSSFPHILYEKPERQSKKWSEDAGLLVKRSGSYQEMSFEAHGVTEAQPTGLHFDIRVYDDLVTWDTTRTGDQIEKTAYGFKMSHNLGVTDGYEEVRVIGTRYDFNDLYSEMIKSGEWTIRELPGDKPPTYWKEETIKQKKADLGPYVFATQISLKPISEDNQKFELEWVKNYEEPPKPLNKYILVDPAGDGKRNHSSFTVMHVVGVDANRNKYLLDIVRDKLSLQERWMKLRDLYSKHDNVQGVGYEKYSMQADIQYIEEKQQVENCVFPITELGGSVNKNDRIKTLQPDLASGKWYFPREYWYTDVEGQFRDLMKEFLQDEYIHFPNVAYKDMLDALSRINDMNVIYPISEKKKEEGNKISNWMPKRRGARTSLGWMAR